VNNMLVEHTPVLAETLAEHIRLSKGAVVIDATVGHGGHSSIFGRTLDKAGLIFGLDVDEKCLEEAQRNLSGLSCQVVLRRANFSALSTEIAKEGIEKADLIIADLGICSAQLTDAAKGLSFQENMRLDMRLDNRLGTNAADIVNNTDEKDLSDVIYNFGQERASRKIARSIVQYRETRKITTTAQLSNIVCRALGQSPTSRKRKTHPATKTFQSLRIAVNSELESLKKLLSAAPEILAQGGQIAIISFHSLEDKLVKEDFKKNKIAGIYEIITKKPMIATRTEILANPRARSAKLRIARKQE